ncbi:MAG: DUF6273 domain-containing protein, partial [Clostridiaceae bacterium]|nr:DUF6273 domain-containing protein [Clostridiaceae bacterium]
MKCIYLFIRYKHWGKIVFTLAMSMIIILGGLLEVYAITFSGSLPIGSYVQFGMYKDKPIVWMVVHNDENGSILFAKDIITVKAFDASGDRAEGRDSKYNTRVAEGSNYWTKANLCEWLNSEEQTVNYSHQNPDAANTMGVSYSTFVNGKSSILAEDVSYADEPGFLTNFHDMEMAAIQTISLRTYLSEFDLPVKDGGNQPWNLNGDNCNAYYKLSSHKIFLLSVDEVKAWIEENELNRTAPWYTAPNGWQINTYWLRTPDYDYAASVMTIPSNKLSDPHGFNAYQANGVRPALCLKPGYSMSGPGTEYQPYVIRYEVPEEDAEGDISDKPSFWAEEEVTRAIRNNLVDESLLSQYQNDITRQEFCTLAVKLYEELSGRKATYDMVTPFSDTNDISVLKSYNLKIIQGVGNGRFAPNENISREQIAVMFYRILEAILPSRPDIQLKTSHEIRFYDNNEISDWAVKGVTVMNGEKVILGTGTGFNPKGTATREQAFILANRMFEKYHR